jgi:group I intron endonuclease
MRRDLTNVIGYIYKITSPLGDVYVGQTINLKERKRSYKGNQFKKQTKLWNNCSFYNWNPSETFEVIDECLCGEDKIHLDKLEIYWVNFYDSYKEGLNCTEGGKGQVGRIWTEEEKYNQSILIKGMYDREEIDLSLRVFPKHTEEHNKKIKESFRVYFNNNERWNKGKETPNEVKQKISNSLKGDKNHFYGKTHTEEVKKKMSESHKGVKLSDETRKKMSESQLNRVQTPRKVTKAYPVLQYDMDNNFINKFASIKEAAEYTGCSSPRITDVCKGNRKHTRNFIWKYENNI